MLELVGRLCLPVLFYGLLTDLASVVLGRYGGLVCTMGGAVLSIPVLGRIYWYRRREEAVKKGEKVGGGLSAGEAGFCVIVGITACLAVNTLISMGSVLGDWSGYGKAVQELYQPPVTVQLAGMGVVVPVAEELAFRGLGFWGVRRSLSFFQAACLSSVLFGLFHGNVPQGIYGFVMGMLLAWAMEKKGTIMAPLLIHGAANMTSVAATALLSM